MIPACWRCQCHGMTMKNNSHKGVEPDRASKASPMCYKKWRWRSDLNSLEEPRLWGHLRLWTLDYLHFGEFDFALIGLSALVIHSWSKKVFTSILIFIGTHSWEILNYWNRFWILKIGYFRDQTFNMFSYVKIIRLLKSFLFLMKDIKIEWERKGCDITVMCLCTKLSRGQLFWEILCQLDKTWNHLKG